MSIPGTPSSPSAKLALRTLPVLENDTGSPSLADVSACFDRSIPPIDSHARQGGAAPVPEADVLSIGESVVIVHRIPSREQFFWLKIFNRSDRL